MTIRKYRVPWDPRLLKVSVLTSANRVVAAMVIAAMGLLKGENAQPHVVLITTLGIGKRVPVADFPAQGRNGQGVVAAKPSPAVLTEIVRFAPFKSIAWAEVMA